MAETNGTINLNDLDVELIVDKSGSMGSNKDTPTGQTRFEYAQETAVALAAQTAPFDPDGITVSVFAGKWRTYENTTPETVARIFQENVPMGSTNTEGVLRARLDAYFARKAAGTARSTVFLVLTDGIPDSEPALVNLIIEASRKLDRDEEVAIQFIQIGRDAAATAFLQRLDDQLVSQGAKFDIVDSHPITDVEDLTPAELIEKAFAD